VLRGVQPRTAYRFRVRARRGCPYRCACSDCHFHGEAALRSSAQEQVYGSAADSGVVGPHGDAHREMEAKAQGVSQQQLEAGAGGGGGGGECSDGEEGAETARAAADGAAEAWGDWYYCSGVSSDQVPAC
jgi:hypothetical protein